MYFDTINDLRIAFSSITIAPSNGEYIIAGYFHPGDGGGGTFIWVPVTPITPLLSNDGGIVIRTPSGSKGENQGYFKRIYSGSINVRWFGAIMGATDPNPPIDPHTGSAYTQPIADVTPYFQRAADSPAAEEGTIYIPAGEYYG
ncbi:MAG: hypothetical protein JST52_12300, partial [Bacteroidetes bacterium]|nr:hypothetical protein [Bacteroidota bacterium]